jgi:hypothetical protein
MEDSKMILCGFAALALEKARDVTVKDSKSQPRKERAFSLDSEIVSNAGLKDNQAPTRHGEFFLRHNALTARAGRIGVRRQGDKA